MRFLSVCVLALAVSVSAAAQSSAPDPALGAKLTSLGLYPKTNARGDWEIVLRTAPNRTLLITVESKKLFSMHTEWRMVYGGFRIKPSEQTYLSLLDANRSSKLGAWEIAPDRKFAVFTCRVPADAPPAVLAACIDAVASAVDSKSAALGGK